MDSAVIDKLLRYIFHQRHLVDYGFIAALTIVLYDYILTIDREISLIWSSTMSYTAALYFLAKYLPIISLCLDIPNRLVVGVTNERCDWSFPLAIWLLTTGVLFAETILFIRTWSVWRRDRIVGLVLGPLFVGMICSAIVADLKYQKSLKFSPPPYAGYRGCFAITASDVLRVDFIVVAVVDFVVLFLMAVSAFRTYQRGSSSELVKVIHRDGLLFYIYLLGSTLVNVIIMSVLPVDLQQLVTPICCSLYSVLTTRIVLNIRQAARWSPGAASTELHEYNDPRPALPHMEFRAVEITNATAGTEETWEPRSQHTLREDVQL